MIAKIKDHIKQLLNPKEDKLITAFLVILVILLAYTTAGVQLHNLILKELSPLWDWQTSSLVSPRLQELSVEQQINRVFGKDATMALAVSQAENGTRQCDRKGGTSNDWGVFQINEVHLNRWTLEQLQDCTQNILIAKVLFDEQSWTPWTVYKTGAYERFLR